MKTYNHSCILCTSDSADLSVWPDLSKNLPDLWLKAHVQHPVCLVQHHIGAPFEVHLTNINISTVFNKKSFNQIFITAESCFHLAHLKDVNEPARSGHTDLSSPLKISDLTTLWRSSKQAGSPEHSFQNVNKSSDEAPSRFSYKSTAPQ